MNGKDDVVKLLLSQPEEIRKSKTDDKVFLYYKTIDRLYCAAAKHESNTNGFLITAYPADKLKEGVTIWKK